MQYKAPRWAGRSPQVVPMQGSARKEQCRGQGVPHSGKPSRSLPSLEQGSTASSQLQQHWMGCKDPVHPGRYPGTHCWGGRRWGMKILLGLQFHLIISYYNRVTAFQVIALQRICFTGRAETWLLLMKSPCNYKIPGKCLVSRQRFLIESTAQGNSGQHKEWDSLSVEKGSKAQEVIFTREFTAKQTAGGESWLQCLLQVHKGDSH